MIKNTASQSIGAQMVNATTGAAFAGTVTVYITIDAGTQAIGTVGAGVCTAEGNGYFSYQPSQAETNGDLIAFTFIGTSAVPATIQVATLTAGQTASISSASAITSQTVLQLLTSALCRINVLQAGESPSAEDAADGLVVLNDFIASVCQLERLMIYAVTRTLWTLTSGTQSYTVGSGGMIDVARPPLGIDHVAYIDTSLTTTFERSLGQPLTDQGWAGIATKSQTGTYPIWAYYSPTYPLGTLSFWYVPTSSTLQGVLYAPTAVTQFGALTDVIAMPPGYNRFLRDNLAVEMFPEWREGGQPDPLLMRAAKESKANVKRANIRPLDMSTGGLFGGGWYDINSDMSYR